MHNQLQLPCQTECGKGRSSQLFVFASIKNIELVGGMNLLVYNIYFYRKIYNFI